MLNLILGINLFTTTLAMEEQGKTLVSEQLSRQIKHPFDPKAFQRLKGEAKVEVSILHFLKRLEDSQNDPTIKSPALKMRLTFQLAGHLANCYFKLLSYAHQVPMHGVMAHILQPTHTNSLEEVLQRPTVSNALSLIDHRMPILRLMSDQVLFEDFERDDFDSRIAIGMNPFFEPLGLFLCSLLGSGTNIEEIQATRRTLEARYTYFNYLRPLDQVIKKVDHIASNPFPDGQTAAKKASAMFLADDQLETNSDIDNSSNYDSDNNYSDDDSLPTETEGPIDTKIDDYFEYVPSVTYLFKELKDTIYHHIDYRYGLDDKAPPLQYPAELLKARKSIPWIALSVLGSAAHIDHENQHRNIRKMFVQALPDLLVDFETLARHLRDLQANECDFFLTGKCQGTKEPYKYPSFDQFKDWYLNFLGLSMLETFIEQEHRFRNSFDDVSIMFEKFPERQLKWLKRDFPFLQSKSRLFSLYYLFVDGELSKLFLETLKDRANPSWIRLFEAFKHFRDDIMHKSLESIQRFEERLNALNPHLWNQLISHYFDILQSVRTLHCQFVNLTWVDLKAPNWNNMLPTLSIEEEMRLNDLESMVRHMSTYISVGIWTTPEVLKNEFTALGSRFRESLPEKRRDGFPANNLLNGKDEYWKTQLANFSKCMSEEMRDLWAQMKGIADNIRLCKEAKAQNKSKEFSAAKLQATLENFTWGLTQLKKIYDHSGLSRFSTVPEGRIAELYLILLRESANTVLYNISDYCIFSSTHPEIIAYMDACNYLSASLPILVSHFGNHKAHLHRLIEVTASELNYQNTAGMLNGPLRDMQKNIQIVCQFLKRYHYLFEK